jgi:actin-related protein
MKCSADRRRDLLRNVVLTSEGSSTQTLRFKLEEEIAAILSAMFAEAEKTRIFTPSDSSITAWLGMSRIASQPGRDSPALAV